MKLISWFFCIIIITFLLLGSMIQKKGMDINQVTNNLNWTFDYEDFETSIIDNEYGVIIPKVNRLRNVIYKSADTLGYSFIEIGKFLLEFGYDNPNYNYKFFFELLRLYIYFMIISLLAPLLIPILALLYILINGLIKLIKKMKNHNHKVRHG